MQCYRDSYISCHILYIIHDITITLHIMVRESVVYWYSFSPLYVTSSSICHIISLRECVLFIGTPSVTLALSAFTATNVLWYKKNHVLSSPIKMRWDCGAVSPRAGSRACTALHEVTVGSTGIRNTIMVRWIWALINKQGSADCEVVLHYSIPSGYGHL